LTPIASSQQQSCNKFQLVPDSSIAPAAISSWTTALVALQKIYIHDYKESNAAFLDEAAHFYTDLVLPQLKLMFFQ
jgi:hypothetical protein